MYMMYKSVFDSVKIWENETQTTSLIAHLPSRSITQCVKEKQRVQINREPIQKYWPFP